MIKDGELFLCARTDGDVAALRVSGEGFYAYDTRYLSEIRFEVGDAPPVALSYAAVDDHAIVDSTNASLPREGLAAVPQQSLSISRELMIASGRLYYLVRVLNFLREAVTTSVSLSLAADFADIFEVRGGPQRQARGHALAPKQLERGLVLAYVGEDETFREAVIEAQPEARASRARSALCARTLGGNAGARGAGDDLDDGRAVDRRQPPSAATY